MSRYNEKLKVMLKLNATKRRFKQLIKYLKHSNYYSIEELKVILDVVNSMMEYIEKGGKRVFDLFKDEKE